MTCSKVSLATPYRPLITLETVDTETPASAATCCIVTRPPASGMLGLALTVLVLSTAHVIP